MANPPSSTSTTAAPLSLRAALKLLPGVDGVSTSRVGTLTFLKVNVDGRRVLVAAVYPSAGVVVPLAAVPDHLQLNEAVCGVANAHGLTVLHGVRDHVDFEESQSELSRHLPSEVKFVREGELAAAETTRELAHVQRLLADLAGTRLSTGLALLTGAPLEMRSLDFPLVDAEISERQRLQGIVQGPKAMKSIIAMRMDEIRGQDWRIAYAEEQIRGYRATKRRLEADISRHCVELAAMYTPEAERERLEAEALLRGEAVPVS